MNSSCRWFAVSILAFGVAACSNLPPESESPDVFEEPSGAEAGGSRAGGGLSAEELEAAPAEARGVEADAGMAASDLEDPSNPLSQRVVYFEFDSSSIRADDLAAIEAHAAYLADHPDQQVVIEGHTDERGSREYNLALGERRAKAVSQALQLNGAAPEQLEVVSFGEEKPAETGQNEAAWSKNRRAEIIYTR